MDFRDDLAWERARSFLPFDLEDLARRTGLIHRRRGTASAEDLARLLLMYALPKSSLVQVSEWGRETGLARMSAEAVFFRLQVAEGFFRGCLETTVAHLSSSPPRQFGKYRLLALDGTCLCGPKASGVDQRLHVMYDLGACAPRWVDVTGPDDGEGFMRHAGRLEPGDLVLADRGYGRGVGLLAALQAGASFLVRFEFSHLRLIDPQTGIALKSIEAASYLPARGWADFPVLLPGWEKPLRVIGSRNDLGQPVWLLTTLEGDELSPEEARSLYSLRWQVELFFKRLKSLLDLDELPTRDGPTARPWIFAKLVLATLAVLMTDERFSPWGAATMPLQLEEVPKRRLEDSYRHPRIPTQTPKKDKKLQTNTQAILLLEA